jgi:hypothetical protein
MVMSEIGSLEGALAGILASFKPITLEEMDSVELMTRTDTKYFFRADTLKDILNRAVKFYRVLEINSSRQFKYSTTYFDTPGFIFYHDHLKGKLNRFKIRQRRYEITGKEFFEVKFKTNKGWTVKSRIGNDCQDYLNNNTDIFLKTKTPYSNSQLQKSITNDFIRITLVNNQLTERATLDYCIGFSNHYDSLQFTGLGILEIKQGSQSKHPVLLQIMKDLKVRPESISKYCLGVASLYPGVKANLLKYHLSKINNLT